MGKTCCVPECRNKSKKPGVSFFCFPKYPVLRREWIRRLRRENFQPGRHTVLCSDHFAGDCFLSESVPEFLQSIGLQQRPIRRRLRSGAVPTLFFRRRNRWVEENAEDGEEPSADQPDGQARDTDEGQNKLSPSSTTDDDTRDATRPGDLGSDARAFPGDAGDCAGDSEKGNDGDGTDRQNHSRDESFEDADWTDDGASPPKKTKATRRSYSRPDSTREFVNSPSLEHQQKSESRFVSPRADVYPKFLTSSAAEDLTQSSLQNHAQHGSEGYFGSGHQLQVTSNSTTSRTKVKQERDDDEAADGGHQKCDDDIPCNRRLPTRERSSNPNRPSASSAQLGGGRGVTSWVDSEGGESPGTLTLSFENTTSSPSSSSSKEGSSPTASRCGQASLECVCPAAVKFKLTSPSDEHVISGRKIVDAEHHELFLPMTKTFIHFSPTATSTHKINQLKPASSFKMSGDRNKSERIKSVSDSDSLDGKLDASGKLDHRLASENPKETLEGSGLPSPESRTLDTVPAAGKVRMSSTGNLETLFDEEGLNTFESRENNPSFASEEAQMSPSKNCKYLYDDYDDDDDDNDDDDDDINPLSPIPPSAHMSGGRYGSSRDNFPPTASNTKTESIPLASTFRAPFSTGQLPFRVSPTFEPKPTADGCTVLTMSSSCVTGLPQPRSPSDDSGPDSKIPCTLDSCPCSATLTFEPSDAGRGPDSKSSALDNSPDLPGAAFEPSDADLESKSCTLDTCPCAANLTIEPNDAKERTKLCTLDSCPCPSNLTFEPETTTARFPIFASKFPRTSVPYSSQPIKPFPLFSIKSDKDKTVSVNTSKKTSAVKSGQKSAKAGNSSAVGQVQLQPVVLVPIATPVLPRVENKAEQHRPEVPYPSVLSGKSRDVKERKHTMLLDILVSESKTECASEPPPRKHSSVGQVPARAAAAIVTGKSETNEEGACMEDHDARQPLGTVCQGGANKLVCLQTTNCVDAMDVTSSPDGGIFITASDSLNSSRSSSDCGHVLSMAAGISGASNTNGSCCPFAKTSRQSSVQDSIRTNSGAISKSQLKLFPRVEKLSGDFQAPGPDKRLFPSSICFPIFIRREHILGDFLDVYDSKNGEVDPKVTFRLCTEAGPPKQSSTLGSWNDISHRQMFALFWKSCLETYFEGSDKKVPRMNLPDNSDDVPYVLGRILRHGLTSCGYWPIALSPACAVSIVTGEKCSDDILLRSLRQVMFEFEKQTLDDLRDSARTTSICPTVAEVSGADYKFNMVKSEPRVSLVLQAYGGTHCKVPAREETEGFLKQLAYHFLHSRSFWWLREMRRGLLSARGEGEGDSLYTMTEPAVMALYAKLEPTPGNLLSRTVFTMSSDPELKMCETCVKGYFERTLFRLSAEDLSNLVMLWSDTDCLLMDRYDVTFTLASAGCTPHPTFLPWKSTLVLGSYCSSLDLFHSMLVRAIREGFEKDMAILPK